MRILLPFLLLSVSGWSQLILKAGDQFVFADTNGVVAPKQRYDHVQYIDAHLPTYVVQKNELYGLVEASKEVIACSYEALKPTYEGRSFRGYSGKRNGKWCFIDYSGVPRTEAIYDSIVFWERLTSSSKRTEHFYFLFYRNGLQQLALISEAGNVEWKLSDFTRLTHDNAVFVTENKQLSSVYLLDEETASFRQLLKPGRYTVLLDSYRFIVVDSLKKTFTEYDNQGVFRRSAPLNKKNESDFYPHNDQEWSVSWDGDGLGPNYGHNRPVAFEDYPLLPYYEKAESSRGISSFENRHFAKAKLDGKRGDFTLSLDFRKDYDPRRDTVLHIDADEVLIYPRGESSVFPARKGKKWGLVDTYGNWTLPAKYATVEVVHPDDESELVVAKTSKTVSVLFISTTSNKQDLVYEGPVSAQLHFEDNQLLVRVYQSGRWQHLFYHILGRITENTYFQFESREPHDSVWRDPEIPYFFHTRFGEKYGLCDHLTTNIVPCIFDSVKLSTYWYPETSRYGTEVTKMLRQPIALAYKSDELFVYRPTGNPIAPSFKGTKLPLKRSDGALHISQDAKLVLQEAGSNRYRLFNLDGQSLFPEPVEVPASHLNEAYFAGLGFWYVNATDVEGEVHVVRLDGKEVVLPER
ncbi:MAG: hypothetical protein V4604_08060 [Bacteroidota bacterium]